MGDPTDADVTFENKAKTILDAGYVYRPYIPLQTTPTVLFGDPEPALPSAVDRLAAIDDSEIAERVIEMDKAHKEWKEKADTGFGLRKSIRTRHAKVLTSPDFFQKVDVSNL